ncbi:SGNH/GDSL hydrolase family protein [Gemmobacter serpentinus]|uniref:SGNH/GDSL hydrolase family protein n=1 Tax=Gemmobacter serpentinus TaxID=2652247 RepID=UPI00124DE98A|nr:SGNH/GDSL hydrolase family protein [Gemmobacter serpentinus]
MPVILTFGDSNTHGSPPMTDRMTYERYDAATRWPQVMARALGWDLVEEGLPGRTAQFPDPCMDGMMDGAPALRQALQSHGPLDALTIMLGTNDVKTRFGASPETVMGGVACLLDLATGIELQTRHGGFKILLICPPPVVETGILAPDFWGAAAKSQALAPLYADLAASRGVGFLDAGQVISVSPVDGVHFSAESHARLGQAVAESVRRL